MKTILKIAFAICTLAFAVRYMRLILPIAALAGIIYFMFKQLKK